MKIIHCFLLLTLLPLAAHAQSPFSYTNRAGTGPAQSGDSIKPGEAAGQGSGVPADCTAPTKGGSFTWVSTNDHLAVVK